MRYPDVNTDPRALDRYDSLLQYYWERDADRVLKADWKLLKALMLTENQRLHPMEVSPAGAIGLTQIMPETAAELLVNPSDPEQSIHGAAVYLAKMWDIWGDERGDERIKFALGSYNAGAGSIIQAQKAALAEGLPTDKWDSIERTLFSITGQHSIETVLYVGKVSRRYNSLGTHWFW